MNNTIILFWNPEISNFTIDDYLDGFFNIDEFNLEWSVYEHKNIHRADRFFMVRVGQGNTGIVMCGQCFSNPKIGDDRNDPNRPAYYVDLDIEWMLHPDDCPHLSIELLTQFIPTFDWTGGHSGRILDPDSADILEKLWYSHLQQHQSAIHNPELAFYNPTPLLDYVQSGISPRVFKYIDGIEILDQFFNETNNLNKASIVDFHFSNYDFALDIIIKRTDNLERIKFHFTNLLDVKWNSEYFTLNISNCRVYAEYDYIVVEFDGLHIQISSENLQITRLLPEKFYN